MADQVSDYKCPACTGPLHFESKTGKLECEYCGSTFTVAEVEKMFAEQDASAASESAAADAKKAAGDEWECASEQWVEKGMKAYNCPSCGAELVMDENTAATACPYCGNTTIVPGQFAGMLKPEFVIPFKLDKKAATESLKKYYQGKFLLPKAFTEGNHLEEVKGVYVPFWLYDGKAHAAGTYEAQKIHSHTEGDYKVTVTEHYRVERVGDIGFEKIPADASSKMPDDMMDSIEPYNYDELTGFSSAYLAGYIADKYDVTAEQNADRATKRAKQSAINAMKADIKGYDKVNTTFENVSVKQGKVSYAMMPVWMLSTKWNNENFLFAMNGQSGKFVGKLPMDKQKATATFIGIVVVLEILMAILTFTSGSELTGVMIALKFLLIPFGIAAIVLAVLKGQLNNVATASAASKYVTDDGMAFTRRIDKFINRTEKREKIEKPANNAQSGSAGAGRK